MVLEGKQRGLSIARVESCDLKTESQEIVTRVL